MIIITVHGNALCGAQPVTFCKAHFNAYGVTNCEFLSIWICIPGASGAESNDPKLNTALPFGSAILLILPYATTVLRMVVNDPAPAFMPVFFAVVVAVHAPWRFVVILIERFFGGPAFLHIMPMAGSAIVFGFIMTFPAAMTAFNFYNWQGVGCAQTLRTKESHLRKRGRRCEQSRNDCSRSNHTAKFHGVPPNKF